MKNYIFQTMVFLRKLIITTIFSALFTILLISIGCSRGNKPLQTDPGKRFSAVSVNVKVIEPQLLKNEFYTTGSILANEKVELRTEVSGRITGIYFQEGSEVKKGDLLLKINDSELQAQLTKADAQEKLAEQE